MPAGYSGTPLAKKLGYREGMIAHLSGAPEDYSRLLAPLAAAVEFRGKAGKNLDLVHLFVRERAKLEAALPALLKAIKPGGMIWVSWPKKAAKVPTDITEGAIRAVALPLGLVDVKVCAVDETWSALKLVIRKERR